MVTARGKLGERRCKWQSRDEWGWKENLFWAMDECTVLCADILLNCTLETCMVLLTSVTPKNTG